MTGKNKTVILMIGLVIFITASFAYKVYQTNHQVDIQALIYPKPKELPDFELTDQNNQSFSRNQLLGQWTIAFFGYTFCPDICPTTMAALAQVANELPPDVAAKTNFLFVSVDPDRDSVERLAGYVPFYHPEFIGVTGTDEQINKLAMSVGAVYMKVPFGDSYQMQHSGRIFIIDPMGRRFGIFAENAQNPTVLDTKTIASDLIQIVRNY